MEIIQTGQFSPLGIPIIIIQYTDGGTETLPDGDWATAAWKAGTIALDQFADEVMRAIGNDIREGIMPADVATFSELHVHVDANVYLLDVAGMPTPAEDDDGLELPNAISYEVDRRLRARTGTDDTAPSRTPDYTDMLADSPSGYATHTFRNGHGEMWAAYTTPTPTRPGQARSGRANAGSCSTAPYGPKGAQ
jgi:hypothetical protein